MSHIILVILNILIAANHYEPAHNKRWVIDSSSRLLIHGTTNVNSFTCAMDCYNNADTLEYIIDEKACEFVFSKNVMVVPVDYFNCGNEMITRDFLETIKSEAYPNIKIRFLTLDDFRNNPNAPVSGRVVISLAGVEQTFTLKYDVNSSSNTMVTLKGMQPVCFSDFKLKAPKKMLGLIQVQENLDVEFHLRLRAVNS